MFQVVLSTLLGARDDGLWIIRERGFGRGG